MKVEETKLARWFKNRLATIQKHLNRSEEEDITSKACEDKGIWTPCDLIAREELNNGGGSAKGFLGISTSECHKCYDYMQDHKGYLIDNDLISEEGWNNSGSHLWHNYNF